MENEIRKEMPEDDWKDAVWDRERKEVQWWTEELRDCNAVRDIRIVTLGCVPCTTTIISDVSCGDAYLVMTDLTAETLEQAVKTLWLDEDTTKAIAHLYQTRTKEFYQ